MLRTFACFWATFVGHCWFN